MLRFILRRLFVSVFILLAALFLVYNLVAISGNPLADLQESTAPNKEVLIQQRIELLSLDVPPPARFFMWLGGILGFFIPRFDDPNGLFGFLGNHFDMGVNMRTQDVQPIIESAVAQTLQLVTGATLIAIVVGIAIGIVTALRQYSGFDYSVTFLAFLTYSLPIFFVAVLLKLYLAIAFNDFLQNPQLPIPRLLLVGVIVGFVFSAIGGGTMRRRLISFGAATVGTIAVLWALELVGWFTQPFLGIPLILVLGAIAVLIAAGLSVGVRHARNLIVTGAVAALAVALWYPLQFVMTDSIGAWFPFVLVVAFTAIGWAAGNLFGGLDRRSIRGNAAIVGFVVAALLLIDRVMQMWPVMAQLTGGRPIATVGSSTAQLAGTSDIWMQMLDGYTHLLLPTLSIALISIAGYSRYARASLLEVMNMDYIRTARAKGLPERTVVMRHALRNALIPVTTVVAADVGAIISGAIVTEQIFAWRAMGTIFSESLRAVDLNPLMGYMLVTAVLVVVFNLVADILYSVLDPRIRLS
ncbi:MAG: ABC transporter permease [Pseudoclavibacter sp.]